MRNEEGAIRARAMRIADRHGGKLPGASYAMLQGRVSDLNRTIHRYANNSARA